MKKYYFTLLLLLVGSLTANPIYTLASEISSSVSSSSSPSSSEEEVLVLAVNETDGFKNIDNYRNNYRSVGSTFFTHRIEEFISQMAQIIPPVLFLLVQKYF